MITKFINTKNKHFKKSQIAIEFLLLAGTSIFILLLILISMYSLSKGKTDEKTYYELDDFGKSLQQEILLASELEDGYVRTMNIPMTLNGRNFNITTNQTSAYNGYIKINYEVYEFYYAIPIVNGTFKKGMNTITKQNGVLSIT